MTCGLYGILPACYEVTSTLSVPPGQIATSRGGFADVWRLTDEKDNRKVFAVKFLRVYEKDPVDKINKVCFPSRTGLRVEKLTGDALSSGIARKL